MVTAREMLTGFILMFRIQATIGSYASENGSHVCRRITADVEIKNLILKYQHTATPCACFEQKMALDYSFQKTGNCYKQWFSENGLKQMCCYDQYGNLLFGPNNGGYLIPDILEPDIEDIHEACCKDSDLCETFYELFPSNNCTGSTDVVHATSWGDPEITTVDGHTYSFNGHGEYTFLENSGKMLQIQARTDFLIKGNQDSTLFVVFVLADNIKNDIITIVYNRTDKTLNLFQHNGSLWANSKDCKSDPMPSGKAGFYLFCSEPFSFGIVLTQMTNIQRITFSGGDFMSVAFDSKKNVTGFRGLAGNLEHEYYIDGNGSKVSINATERDLFYFGESWTVSQNDSKFNYTITGGNFTYWNGNHTTPRFLQETAEKGDLDSLFKGFSDTNITKFNETCRNSWDKKPNIQCLVTIAKTRNVTQGESVMAVAEKKHHTYEINHNTPPQFKNNTPTFLNVTLGVNSKILDLKLYVTDDFDDPENMTYNVVTQVKNYTFNDGRFTWNVGTYLRYSGSDSSLTFTVNDTLGFSATKQMIIYYCGCEDPLQCGFSSFNKNSSANIMKAACKCPAYSEGLYCERHLDPCKNYTCYGTCNGSFNRSSPAWPCKDCPKGRRSQIVSNNQTCENTDECAVVPNPCGQICTDTDGSYKCSCEEGFKLNIDGYKCDDIDECSLPPSKCTEQKEVCLNTEGKFSCICEPGYSKKNGTCIQTGDTTKGNMQLEDVIRVSCTGSQWDISVSMDKLQLLYPRILPKEIFFGQTNCQGTLENTMLRFKQSLHMCMTTEKTSDKTVIYNNKLFYAILDPIKPFLIRQHVWTFAVECDVMRVGLGSSHLHHNIETHKATAAEQYNVSVELFSDQNFMQPVTSSKHTIGVGDDVYVKVSTTLTDWNVKMRLHTCYTKPFNNVTQDKDVMLISDGCEVESNTHIISQSTHETKFVFQDFEYVTNDEGLYIYCNATFCESKDYSAACVQSCRQSPTFVG